METFFLVIFFFPKKRFKSYYVVWKLFGNTTYEVGEPSLNRTMQYGNSACQPNEHVTAIKFKSYYVVWKPDLEICLNYAVSVFKSYYVVWKQQEWKEIDDGKDEV